MVAWNTEADQIEKLSKQRQRYSLSGSDRLA